ncbi:MAG: hypothetical protein IH869_06830 [Chloroflexi bacterium]|nr:hypothetical protein [Chloroflexota bacterium]
MAIIHRRTFYAKVGQAGPLVAHLREFGKIAAQYGVAPKERFLTDHQSGRTDRVVWEWEVESMAELDMEAFAVNQAAADAFSKWERTMNGMIEYAEVENWKVE